MDDSTRVAVGAVLCVAGFAWFAGVKVWRFLSLEHTARMFWLHLTAPLVGGALMLAGVLLVATTDRFRQPNAAEADVAPDRRPLK